MGVPTRWELNKFEKIYTKSFQGSYVHLEHRFDVFDILLKLVWYIFIIRIYLYSAFFFCLSTCTQPGHTNKAVQQAVPLIATHINDNDINND